MFRLFILCGASDPNLTKFNYPVPKNGLVSVRYAADVVVVVEGHDLISRFCFLQYEGGC